MSACRACCFPIFRWAMPPGRPKDQASQAATLELALAVLERAPAARTTVQSPLLWSSNADWKLDYQNPARLTADEIAKRRADFDRQKAVAKAAREGVDAAGRAAQDLLS